MGDDQPSPSSSRGKHRRSSDDASDEEPKRRKHHHHRQHRRHRHHSKHGEYRNEEDEPIFSEKKSEPALRIMPADDELEEGEIVEEEEGGGEIEYGEVRNDHAAPFPMQEPSCEEDLIPEHTLDISSTANNMKALINCCAKENDKDGGFLFEATVDTPNNAGDYGNLAEVESSKKLNPLIGVPKKEKHRDIDLNGFKSRDRPRSPAFKKSSYLLNPTDKDDHLSRYFDPSAEKERSTPKLGRQVDEKSISVDKNFSISPRSPNDRHKETERSSSSSKHCGEIGNRDQSMCDDHATGKLYNQVREDDAEECIPLNHSERQIEGRNNSDYKRSRGHDRLDKYIRSDRESHKERESSVYSRHNGHDSRHSSRDRLREGVERRHDGQDKGKEVESSINGFRDRDEPPNDKGVYRDREMSRCSSRYDGREDRHGRRDKERYKDREREKYSRRDRERVKERDRSRDRFMVIERIRNVKGESARNMNNTDQDKNRNRERKNHSYKDRERVDHKERNPNCYHDEKRDSRRSKYDNMEPHKERTKYNESAKDATINIHYSEEEKRYHLRVEDVEDYQGRIEQQLAMQDEEDIEKIKEESRKRRQAILEKYKQKQNLENFEPSPSVHEKEELVSKENDMEQVSKTFDSVDNAGVEEVVGQHDSFDAYVADTSFTLGKSPVQNGLPVTEKNISASGLGEGSPKSERSTDMFCDDIFGDSPASIRKSGKDGLLKIERSGLHDNWDDAEGYYSHRLGEVLDGRYEIIAAQGKGVFSTVVRVKDLKAGKGDPEEVAIKIIRSNDTMYKAGMEELVILKKLSGADPEDKRHCVRFLSSFKYRNHLCLTFESLHMNLREVLKKFGRNIGLRLTAVRAYAKQLFIALKHLKNCGVLHCDIKPDNMLVNEAKNVLKLCDFGNAMFAGKNEITPYLVSRFYRAPEIILGLPYDHPLDIWSVGCCLFELYTGKVLFPGPSNNDMLRLHMELKGPFPKKMLRKLFFSVEVNASIVSLRLLGLFLGRYHASLRMAAFIDQHFDQDLNFHAAEEDPVTKKAVKRLLLNIKPKDIGTLISGSPGEDPKMLANFKDLLERAFVLDPEKRMTVSQALSHPFITGK